MPSKVLYSSKTDVNHINFKGNQRGHTYVIIPRTIHSDDLINLPEPWSFDRVFYI